MLLRSVLKSVKTVQMKTPLHVTYTCSKLHQVENCKNNLLQNTRYQSTTSGFASFFSSPTISAITQQTDERFAQVVSNAEKIVGYPTSFMSLRCLLSDEMSNVAMYIRKLVGTNHPLLKIARGLVFNGRYGTQTRGLIVLLLSKAAGNSDEHLDNDVISGIHNKQRHLAEIIETIHLANMIHKGIVNLKDLDAANGTLHDMEFGNKIAILTGDFLLASACMNLAKLENPEVVELVSNSISNMMESNFIYASSERDPSQVSSLDDWSEFTYLSRGSLLANCCRSALKISGHSEPLQNAAFQYGKHLSYAHQIREELRPFIDDAGSSEEVSINSLPLIHYSNNNQMSEMNLEENLESVRRSDSIQASQSLCDHHGQLALVALEEFDNSSSKNALKDIVTVLTNSDSHGS